MSAGMITGFVIGGVILILLGIGAIWWAIKVFQNKRYAQGVGKYLTFMQTYGHWFLWPLAFMFLVVGIAFSFASLMIKPSEEE